MNISSFLPHVTKYSWKNFCDSIQSHESFLPKFRAIRYVTYKMVINNIRSYVANGMLQIGFQLLCH